MRKELQGSSLTSVANKHHVDPRQVSAPLTSARQAEIDRAAKSGTLPPDLARTMRSRLRRTMVADVARELRTPLTSG